MMTHRLVVCAACLLMLAPRPAPALVLGAIEARSVQHEPLDARILLSDVRSGDIEGLKVELGSMAQFELAGVARLPFLDRLRFTAVEQDGGGGYIRVWTKVPVPEPSLTFLVNADWPRGRTVRGYRLRLDPASASGGRAPEAAGEPEARASASGGRAPEAAGEPEGRASASGGRAPEAVGEPEVRSTASDGRAPEAVGEPEARASVSTPASPPASSGATYGPVTRTDTLWSIASRFRPDASVSVPHMMLELLEANPEAFAIRNVNALNAGVMLRIPARDEFGTDDAKATTAWMRRQNEEWKQYRGSRRVASAPSAPATAGRIEIVSPEAATDAAGREEDADVRALRAELVLAMEEVDASRRENDELKSRLARAEEHVKELRRLVALKDEEIAALQAMVEKDREIAALRAVADGESGPSPARAGAEPESMPFGLDALPIDPMLLVGGAGLLLILLGVVALLRRRSPIGESVGGDDAPADPYRADAVSHAGRSVGGEGASADPPPSGEDDLLRELQAVAAGLADDKDAPPERRSRAAPAADPAGGAEAGAMKGDGMRFEFDSHAERRIAELWKDDPRSERPLPAGSGADDGGTEVPIGTAPDPADLDTDSAVGRTGDEFDIGGTEVPTGTAPDPTDLDTDSVGRRTGDEFDIGGTEVPIGTAPDPADLDTDSVGRRTGDEFDIGGTEVPTGTAPGPADLDTDSVGRRTGDEFDIGGTEVPIGTAPDPADLDTDLAVGRTGDEFDIGGTEVPTGTAPGPADRDTDSAVGRTGDEFDIGETEVPIGTAPGPVDLDTDSAVRRTDDEFDIGGTEVPIGTAPGPADLDTDSAGRRTDDEFDIGGLAGPAAERTADSAEPAGAAARGPDVFAGGRDTRTTGPADPAPERAPGADRESAAADEGAGLEPVPEDGAGGSRAEPRTPFDVPADDGKTGASALEEVGEDEAQTRIDLAHVYLEMGDTDRARRYLEAVLTEKDAARREIARKMLSKLP